MRDTLPDLIRERNSLRLKLWADDAFAHGWLCHADGSTCPDGCDGAPKVSRLKIYISELEDA